MRRVKPPARPFPWPALAAALLVAMTWTGCTPEHYRKSADRAAYQGIQARTAMVPNMDPRFTIEQTNLISLDHLPVAGDPADYLGAEGASERGAHVLRLEDALDIALHHSRSYQSRKEQLYLSSLSLNLVRHQFTPIFSAEADSVYAVNTVEREIIIGTNIVTDGTAEQNSVGGSGSINVSWLIRDVGRISAAFTADFLRFMTGDPSLATSSQLSATFLRPMLRDAGFKREQEALIQAERNLLYDLRDFTQFRKDFSVQIATDYYGVLGRRDAVRNSYLGLDSSRKNAERGRAMVAEGRDTTANLGRFEQAELSAESAWINAVRSYKQSIDNFKFQLGMSVDDNIVLDDAELEALQIRHPDLAVEDSVRVALAARLDYMNSKDRFDDASRDVALAADALRPQLNVSASVAMVSDPNSSADFRLPDPEHYRWNAGIAFDPGLDRTAERNAYRAALINRNRAARDVVQQEDQIRLQVRDSWRTLEQAKRSYEISEISVRLAERRVEEQDILAELGRAEALNQVDAQNALIDSKNQRTLALVTHTIARLQFWKNMGILYIKENGQWEELNAPIN